MTKLKCQGNFFFWSLSCHSPLQFMVSKHSASDAEEAKLERQLQQDAQNAHQSNSNSSERRPFSDLDLTPATSKALDAMGFKLSLIHI